MSAAAEFEAQIDGVQVKGWVAKDGSSYRAYGDFRGERIDVRSTTQSRAESMWRERANHKANE
ncbi:hypothetical protein OX90_23175 [Pseudomonas coronafaciens pv. porri]|uniref:Uncharacterized protein n=1 Tax=Pseudomonas coronafaciens pv. porri TaxID=83964 RepID=A0ABR5JIF3_9PSED|nr:hypothetical protein [Pseudomonas coronafaciens]KOP50915.1 hypothetical protein OX88_27030 [Pseudomonas coronafaciens pv. porri]KOP53055.1 hypothetical protein OX90_23175 [Pseudomonas coronafaciens pv. porri]KPY25669.1 hypothetical protein ALO89_200182 [Pseudomonas coronafaciens pv. porri]RMU83418.1 hypothetical protein ALP22_200061 [Pseudomonas coronafaciens pv. porri]RMW06618.1 hypothetical protein ALO99_200136 [Pseudomonas coronafaciens pv. porri]